jgi:phosphoenolpyruvate synthase/pyruvate phosphate dikinase
MKIIAKGLGASTGIITNRIRVIFSPDELDQLKDGEILVVKSSSPAWTVGMLRASAIISEFGGIISHAAIVAREIGIPCIVSVEHATSLLLNGMLVHVDGETGLIYEVEDS